MTPLLFVGLDREGSIIVALVALIVAALTVSVGAWVLLARERRTGRRHAPPAGAPAEVLPTSPPSRLHD